MGELTSLTSAARARVEQAERAVHEADAAYQSRVSARDSAKAQLDMIRPLVEHGIEPRMTLVQMPSAAAVATTDAASAAAGVSRGKAAEIGRATCRGSVWQYGKISVVAVSLKTTNNQT